MRKTIPDVVGQFVLSKDECGFQDVVDSLAKAESVTVVTYNVSANDRALLDLLRDSEAPVRLITMIPNRFEKYTNNIARQQGARAIGRYLAAVSPQKFGPLARVFFCFANHAKIILTDAVGYVGSANYSEKSARNWEAGVIIRDRTTLAAIAAAVDEIEADSVEYYGKTMQKAVAPLLAARQLLAELRDCLVADIDENDVSDVRDAVESIRDAISEGDRAWGEVAEQTGPICSRIEMERLDRIERFFESDAVSELGEANGWLRRALDGDIPLDDLPTDRDGNISDSAFHTVVRDAEYEQEARLEPLKVELEAIREDVDAVCSEIEVVCDDISTHLGQIRNTE
ncbi:MAG: hypothetical protein HQ567_30560 [Candidatus Nealsonbacteria bacterium]|nr:hypothetical protein [Candidatus Nealsonbacteria bacterium]